jgi:Bacterial regulatory proteins, luxR family
MRDMAAGELGVLLPDFGSPPAGADPGTARSLFELFISPRTASVHVSNILGKLGVISRGEAAATAYRQHLLDDS